MTPRPFGVINEVKPTTKVTVTFVGKNCFILLFSSSSRILQLESVKTNEINHDIHLVFTLF